MNNEITKPDPMQIARRTNVVRSSVSYASQDFDSILKTLIQYVKDNFGQDYNDFVHSSYGVMIMDLIAYAMDKNSFKLDVLLNESYITTAQLRSSLVRIASSMGYTSRSTTSATAPFSISVPTPYNDDIEIPPGMTIERVDVSGRPIRFELYSMRSDGKPDLITPIIISAGQTTTSNVVGVQGETVFERFISNGEANQVYIIYERDFVQNWTIIEVDGIQWEKVDFLTGHNNQFMLYQDTDQNWTVRFGNGVDGMIPSQGSPIIVSYRRGIGKRGNIVSGFYNEMINISSISGQSIPVQVTNYENASGGSDEETNEEIRKNAVAVFKAQDRAVTGSDYEILSELFFSKNGSGIVKTRAVTRHSGCSANVITLFAIKSDGDSKFKALSDFEKNDLIQYLEDRSMLTDVVRIHDANIINFNITVVIRTFKAINRSSVDVEQRVRTRLENYFDIVNWNIGQSVTVSGIIKALSSIQDIAFVEAAIQPESHRELAINGDLDINQWEIASPKNIGVQVQFED